MIRKCVICRLPCGYNSKYCRACWAMLRKNWAITYKIKAKYHIRVCPICLVTEIEKGDTFCPDCKKMFMKRPKKRFIKKTVTQWSEVKTIQRK